VKVLLVHNFYREPGGEDYAFRAEATVLTRHGHEVSTFERSSADATDSVAGVMRTALATPWASRTVRELEEQLARFRPAIVHFHNTFPLISPGAYYACSRAGIPVVQTLHNYRLLCAKADLFRDGSVCEDCVGRSIAWPAIGHRCYRDSLLGTTAVSGMLALHKSLGTWTTAVHRYIALTNFAQDAFVRGGLPSDRIVVKPNFLVDPPRRREGDGDYALFVGRLTEEKGIETLVRAWDRVDIPLHILGDGPRFERVARWGATRRNVQLLGWVANEKVRAELSNARFLVFPSLWYEGFPIAILEAMASGVPVLASQRGSLGEIVGPHSGGVTFEAGSDGALASAATQLWQDSDRCRDLGRTTSAAFESNYSEAPGYRALTDLYSNVAEEFRERRWSVSAAHRIVTASDEVDPHEHDLTGRPTVHIETTPITNLNFHQAVSLISGWLEESQPRRVATVNLDFLRLAAADDELANALSGADLVTADGTPLLWLASLQGQPLCERVAGADLILPLVEQAHRRGRSIFLLGGAPGAAQTSADLLTRRFQGLRIAGTASPVVDMTDEASCLRTVETVAAGRPDLLFVALGCPKQDLFLARYLEALNCRVGIGVGASLDILAGNVRRAPEVLQRAGLDWAFRLIMEPRRLGGRYARDLAFLARAAIRARRNRGRRGSRTTRRGPPP